MKGINDQGSLNDLGSLSGLFKVVDITSDQVIMQWPIVGITDIDDGQVNEWLSLKAFLEQWTSMSK